MMLLKPKSHSSLKTVLRQCDENFRMACRDSKVTREKQIAMNRVNEIMTVLTASYGCLLDPLEFDIILSYDDWEKINELLS